MNDKRMEGDAAACDFCGQLIVENGHDYSNDIMISTTLYEADGSPRKTMEPTSVVHTDVDYIVICPDCEGPMFHAWNMLAQKLITNGLPRKSSGALILTDTYVNGQIEALINFDEGADITDGATDDEK